MVKESMIKASVDAKETINVLDWVGSKPLNDLNLRFIFDLNQKSDLNSNNSKTESRADENEATTPIRLVEHGR